MNGKTQEREEIGEREKNWTSENEKVKRGEERQERGGGRNDNERVKRKRRDGRELKRGREGEQEARERIKAGRKVNVAHELLN